MNKRWRRFLITLIFPALLIILGASPQPQESVTYERYDVEIVIQSDGSLLVTEIYQIRFEGEFHTGFAEIPLSHVTEVTDVQVWDSDRAYTEGGSGPGTFTVEHGGYALFIEWEYEPTSGTEVRTFTISYRVLGALQIYPDEDALSWVAVPEERGDIPVEASQVIVHLPQPVSDTDLVPLSFGAKTSTRLYDNQTLVFEALAPIPDGVPLEILVSFPHGLTTATAPEWQRAVDEIETVYRWQALDVDMTIAPDGTLTVHEAHKLAVDEGYLYQGYREIPWLYLDEISQGQVQEGERAFDFSTEPCNYCYVVEEQEGETWVWMKSDGEVIINEDRAGSTLLEWAFPGVGPGDTVTFDLTYTALGAVRVFTDAQEIVWTVVFADRDVDVEGASLRLHFPPGVSTDDVVVKGGATAVEPDGSLWVVHNGPVPAEEAWSVRIRLPADATQAERPRWQNKLERVLAEQEAYREAERQATIRQRRWQLILGVLGALLPILGLVSVLVAWYVWGRDQPAPVVAEYLTEPPSDLPPGIVAYLVDEKPTVKGALADLLHLATLGLISVDLRESDFTVTLNWGEKIDKGATVQVSSGGEVVLAEHERTLFNTLQDAIKWIHRPTRFSDIRTFTSILPTIYEQMGEATTQYFSTRPDKARQRWGWTGQRIVIASVVWGFGMLCAIAPLGRVVLAPPLGLAVAGLMLMGISRWMPQRTTLGIEEAARWRAFGRYLKSLKEYGDLDAAQKVLDRYFPYAVALDVEEIVLRQAEKMGAMIPIWMVPVAIEVGAATATATTTTTPTQVGRPRVRERLSGMASGVARGLRPPQEKAELLRAAKARPALAERPVGADFSLDGLSNSLSGSLDRASRSLSSLLNAAVGEAESSPFEVIVKGAGKATKLTWEAGTSTMKVMGDILESSSSGGGRGSYSGRSHSKSGSSYRSSSWSSSSRSSSRSRGSSRRSSWSPSRSSSRSRSPSRSRSGGGRRGFR